MFRQAIGKAHGKLILIGEHSVVYDKPAIALPFSDVGVTALIKEQNKDNDIMFNSGYFSGPLSKAPEELSGIKACVKETLHLLNTIQTKICISIESTIPSGRGLGSSAAVAHSIVKGIFNYFDTPLRHDVQMHLVQIAETHAHGNPSGIDMEATSNDCPIWFQKGRPVKRLEIHQPLYLVVADSGKFGDTKSAVDGIRNLYLKTPEIARKSIDLLEDYTYKCERYLSSGKITEVGKCLDLAQIELTRLGVSDETLDHLIETSKRHGALGAKLTGGGRGGCILALAQDQQHAANLSDALTEAGAFQIWTNVIS
ncbi:mevalonate kinase [Sporosarcina thermotolerans]|uniref:mevalonate kinase n=1 Tax=Sporosarcina thermotolerans TaxID=633404 RepID=A0AAW9A8K3_9BACL|nr:mevalonate kinase [Sporosarcina thermotolerans]MDW0115458.1 mevalonate kinase [Sporosarcina thermotolerans]WHT47214.1 mevalonate kinase [Sporosarcina thermotolerans]